MDKVIQARLNLRLVRTGLIVLAVIALLAASHAQAGMYPVQAGELPKLEADEGLLIVAVDTTMSLDRIYMRKDGSVMKSSVLKKVEAGRTSMLMRLPAGRYGWHSVSTGFNSRFELADDPEFYFDVRPGVITYGGDLVYLVRAQPMHADPAPPDDFADDADLHVPGVLHPV